MRASGGPARMGRQATSATSERRMDGFEIDMELLRRVGAVRVGVEASVGGGDVQATAGLRESLTAAASWARQSGSPAAEALEAVGRVASAGAPGWEVAMARLLPALEEVVLAPGDAAARVSLVEGARAMEESLCGACTASQAGAFTRLDELAAFLVEMEPSPQDVAALAGLLEAALAGCMRSGEGHEGIVAPLEAARAALAPVVGKRTRKAAREAALAEVSGLVEEAALLADMLETEEGALSTERAEPSTESSAPDAQSPEAAPRAAQPAAARPAPPPPAPAAPVTHDIPASDPLPEGAEAELISDFVTESFDYLEQAEEALLALETTPGDAESVNVVFRAFHTIKGVSGFLELRRLSDLAHHAESLLSRVRDGGLIYTGTVADLSLRSVDALKALLDSVHAGLKTGVMEIPAGYGALLRTLADPGLVARLAAEAERGEAREVEATDGSEADGGEDRRSAGNAGADASVRIRTDRLDRLVDMVGELVIAHSMLAQDPVVLRERGTLARKVDHTAKLLRELQDLSTALRMVPLKPAFRKVSRVIRDLSRKSGKPVRLVTDGEDTEIDRTMVDVLADPLVHMVRNSVDHGIETPEERIAAGKPREGVIRISAYQSGGNVVIELADDGRGLDRDRILAKARQQGILDADRGLSDREVFNLIFAAGFSTAAKVTEVSGRGVGMDVVRRNVESLRGRVAIESTPGQGTTFSIILPLTLAITDGMVIRIGRQRFIIPSLKIVMSQRPEPSALSTVSGKGEMVLVHEELLPVIRLHRAWGIPGAVEDPTRGLLVIVGEGRRKAALLVDELVTQQQFVVKPLTGMVAGTRGVAGGAIMGNGDVGLILDPDALVSGLLTAGGVAA